jgi:PTS system cellobiose-specific IIA component
MNDTDGTVNSEINAVALEIILHAGDARLCVTEAFSALAVSDFSLVDAKLSEAKRKLADAHSLQTEIVQSEGEGNEHNQTFLFSHAQDTLMTIYSEMNIARQLKGVFENIAKRLKALEEETHGKDE